MVVVFLFGCFFCGFWVCLECLGGHCLVFVAIGCLEGDSFCCGWDLGEFGNWALRGFT